ncbi:helix-turn-helix transcriptional regulator [Tolumonas lignilytica]|uniref:helix-turn-helix transcriptional regulator n=1 Tax=Tolumonas lignilytica TaxID=1283284 RepID=UPI000464784B|nr:helix-turn-helix transcriptional regulator [Tolumonas lignilytica]
MPMTPLMPMPSSGNADPNPAIELGIFLRSRRESLDPVRVGIVYNGRRRTPGLRREEVAQLADVSTTWYTWLEQGRDVKASAITLSAIAQALRCSEAETRHLFSLAGLTEPTSHRRQCRKLTEANQLILDQLSPLPAIIQNARFDILGHNKAYVSLTGIELSALSDEECNCLYLAFNHPGWRQRLVNIDQILPRLVGSFRASMAKHRDDPLWNARLDSLRQSSAHFCELWERYEILDIENHHKQFQHPELGLLSVYQVNWWSAPANGERLMVYVADDDATRQKLLQLTP